MKRITLPNEVPVETVNLDTVMYHIMNGSMLAGYKTQSDVAALMRLSEGQPRSSESLKPECQLWGFFYLTRPNTPAKFVRKTARESIEMAIGNGTHVILFEGVRELIHYGNNLVK